MSIGDGVDSGTCSLVLAETEDCDCSIAVGVEGEINAEFVQTTLSGRGSSPEL
jgi:hypothetical protein